MILNRAEQLLAHARRQHTQVAALFLDLDNLKDIDAALGHEAGDQLLAGVAARKAGALREGETVDRLGGDDSSCWSRGPRLQQVPRWWRSESSTF